MIAFPRARAARARGGALSALAPWVVPAVCTAGACVYAMVTDAATRELDLATYLVGGRHAFDGRLYRVVDAHTHLGFTYPPFAALLVAPFGHLSPLAVRVGFTACNLAALFVLVAVCLHAAHATRSARALVWWSLVVLPAALFLAPIDEAVNMGQVDIVIVLAVAADLAFPRGIPVPGTHWRVPQGVTTGVAAAVKLIPLAFFPVLFLGGRRDSARRGAGAFACATAGAALVLPAESVSYWTHLVFDVRRIGSEVWVGNQSLRGAILRAAHHPVPSVATDLAGACVLVVGVLLAADAYRRGSPLLALCVAWAAESLGSPVTWVDQLDWTVALVAWLALAPDRPRKGRLLALIAAVFVRLAPNWWAPARGSLAYHEHWWQLPIGDAFTLLCAAVLAGTAVRWWHVRTRHDGATCASDRAPRELVRTPRATSLGEPALGAVQAMAGRTSSASKETWSKSARSSTWR